jgi:DNA-binding transcriptional MerR regulator
MKKAGKSEEEQAQESNIFEHSAGSVYTIDAMAELAQIPRRVLVVYHKHGLVAPAFKSSGSDWYFDDRAIQAVKRIGYLRRECGMNLKGIKLMMDLIQEVERLREEVRFFYRQ